MMDNFQKSEKSIKNSIDIMMGVQFAPRLNPSLFIEFHPLFWGVGYVSFSKSTAITLGCFTFGVEY